MNDSLYQVWRPKLLRFCTQVLGHSHDAEEVVHDVFARLLEKQASYSLDAEVGVLLFKMARNRCIDLRRRKVPEPRDDLVVRAPDDGRVLDLREALLLLEHEEREVISLTALDGLGYREVAAILGCSLGTVAARKYAAVEKLRRRLAP